MEMMATLLSVALAVVPGAGMEADAERSRMVSPAAVTVSYEAEVVGWDGSLPEVWALGQRVNVSYTVSPDGPFEQTAPDSRIYPQSLVSTRIEVPDLGLVVQGGTGFVNVIDDRPIGEYLFDNVWFRSNSVEGSPMLGGELVTASGVDLYELGPAAGVPSLMVEDFAIPLEPVDHGATLWAFLFTEELNYGFVQLRLLGGPALTTVDYESTVTRVSGAQAAEFAVGQPILVSYTVDAATADTSTNPDLGLYRNGLRSLTVLLPQMGQAWDGGVGDVYVYHNVGTPLSDQVFFMSNVATGTVGGLPVNGLEVDFIKRAEEGLPGMVDSTAMPLEPLETEDAFVMFRTSAGLTFVTFDTTPQEPDDRMPALIAAARDAIAWLAGSPTTARGVSANLGQAVDAIELAHGDGDVAAACMRVARTITQLDLWVRIRRVAAADATELRGILQEMDAELGCAG